MIQLRMLRRLPFAVVLLAATLTSASAFAQAPKPGDYYEDSVDLGFKVRVPAGWDFTPPQPNEANLIAKYVPPFNKYISLGGDSILPIEGYLIKFDRRPASNPEAVTTDADGNVEIDLKKLRSGSENLANWLERDFRYGRGFRLESSKELKIDKTPATEYLYKATTTGGNDFNIYAVVFQLEPEVEVALVFNGPEDSKRWRKYASSFDSMAKSFRRVAVKEIAFTGTREGDSAYRARKRGELELQVATQTGWELYETPNYFIISNVSDRAFLAELQDRLEAIRAVYEAMYPWDQADRIRLAADKEKAEEKAASEAGQDEGPSARTTSAKASPRELSRCSVVRVCAKQEEYVSYGGPPNSAGYWYWVTEELVLYDDRQGGGRRNTWAVLNHEAFHQYIFYLYGSISPHSWYNEGHGDYFSGYEYKHKRFNLKPFDWRQRTIQQALRDGKHVPLKDLVHFTQDEYYGQNKYGVDGGQNYAQGWSFVYFLRTGAGKARGWRLEWGDILDVYFETLAATGERDAATEKAFAGIDWQALEESWKSYIL